MLNTIYSHHKLSDEFKTCIWACQNKLKQKISMKARKQRKDRIVQKVIVDKQNTRLYTSVYSSVLQVMRKYVKIKQFKQSNNCLFKVCCQYVWKIAVHFLKTANAIDPVAILAKGTVTLKVILHLPDTVTNVLSSTDLEDYEKECRKIMVDPTLPPALVEKKYVRAGTWWFKLKYPLLSKMSLALLNIFHGPRVEINFIVGWCYGQIVG